MSHFAGERISLPSHSFAQHIFGHLNSRSEDENLAYIDDSHNVSISYKELRTKSIQLANNLRTVLNVTKGDVVTICSHSRIEYPVAVLGVIGSGCVVCTANHLYSKEELNYVLKDTKTKVLVTSNEYLEKYIAASEGTSVSAIIVLEKEIVQKQNNSFQIYNFSDMTKGISSNIPMYDFDNQNDILCILYSSGTTGRSKGVALNHESAFLTCFSISKTLFLERGDVVFAVPPFSHIYGLYVCIFASVLSSAALVFQKRFNYLKFVAGIENYRANHLLLVPPIIVHLAKDESTTDYDLSSVKSVGSGAAPLAKELITILQSKFTNPNYLFAQGYGLTECGAALTITRPDTSIELLGSGTVGKLVDGTEVKIVNVDSRKVVPIGEDGEIICKSKGNMLHYINNPQMTKNSFEEIDGELWLKTGDIGRCNEEGYFWITDRLKELIKYKGYQVPPAELEELLLTHSSVKDCAVIGVKDETAGELPKAYVVLDKKNPVSEDELKQFVKEKVAPYKQLKGGVEFIDVIPKSPSGKILRRILRDQNQ